MLDIRHIYEVKMSDWLKRLEVKVYWNIWRVYKPDKLSCGCWICALGPFKFEWLGKGCNIYKAKKGSL